MRRTIKEPDIVAELDQSENINISSDITSDMQLQRKIRSIIHRYNDKRFAVGLLKMENDLHWNSKCGCISITSNHNSNSTDRCDNFN